MLFLFVIKKSYDHILTKKYLEVKIKVLKEKQLLLKYMRILFGRWKKHQLKLGKLRKDKNLGNSGGHILNSNARVLQGYISSSSSGTSKAKDSRAEGFKGYFLLLAKTRCWRSPLPS